MLREGLFSHHRRDFLSLAASGTPVTAQGSIGPVPEGYAWYIEAWAYTVLGTSHTALLALAVTPDNGTIPPPTTWDYAGVISGSASAAFFATLIPGNPIYVPPAHFIRPYLWGGTLAAADVVNFNLQASVHQLDPPVLMSPEDRRQAAASHQHLDSGLVETAVAARRAV